MNALPETIIKPAVTGLVGGALSYLFIGGNSTITFPVVNVALPSAIAYAVVLGGSSLVSESTKNYIIPAVGLPNVGTSLSYITMPVITGLATAAISTTFVLLSGGKLIPVDMIKAFVVGGLCQMTGEYTYTIISNAIPQQY